MSANLDEAFQSLQVEPSYSNEAVSPQFRPFPDEILPLIFQRLTAFQRCLILSVCRKWNQIIVQGRSFWQVVDVPIRLPISIAISILRIFNLRSGFLLREVLFETVVRHVTDLNRIFDELEKSSKSIKILILPQINALNTRTKRRSRELLSNLCFLYAYDHLDYPRLISEIRQDLVEWESQGRAGFLLNEESKEVSGLAYYCTRTIHSLDRDDVKWFRRLQYLQVNLMALQDLHCVLKALKSNLQALNLSLWRHDSERSEELGLETIFLNNSDQMEFYAPYDADAAQVLSGMIQFQGKVEFIIGNLLSLLCFKVQNSTKIQVYLHEEKEEEIYRGRSLDPEELKEKTDLLFEMNPSLPWLTLYASEEGSGSHFHLNYFLERLTVPVDLSTTEQHETQGLDSLLLPKLRTIKISNPIELDGKLLKKCLESRRKLSPSFRILVWSEGGYVGENKWEEQSWMK